jgi:hypothetical protein
MIEARLEMDVGEAYLCEALPAPAAPHCQPVNAKIVVQVSGNEYLYEILSEVETLSQIWKIAPRIQLSILAIRRIGAHSHET